MDYGDRHLFDDLVVGIAGIQQRLAVDRDGVRQRPRVVGVPLGQRHPFVQPEQLGFRRVAVGDEHNDIVHRGGQLGRDEIQCVRDQLVEPLRVHPHGHPG